ncbi:MAG: hypothetical protein JNG82_11185 [Opitutaceae bacterium]|nr:hypothetical protein [Opitutaceae bacterium]
MALKPKHPDQAPGNGAQPPATVLQQAASPKPAAETPMEFRSNPVIEKNIADYKAANPETVKYFTDLVAKHPDRAVNYHFYREWQKHDRDTREAVKQLPQAKAIYEKMTPDSRHRVDAVLAEVNPFNHTKRFVGAVFSEMNRQGMADNRRALRAPGHAAPAMSAG